MKASFLAAVVALVQSTSAHYIWTTLLASTGNSTTSVRLPGTNSPVTTVGADTVCNIVAVNATTTTSVAAGSTIGFLLDNTLYHLGPSAIYLGQVPSGKTAATWDGSGTQWFKIAEWGATYPNGVNGAMSFSNYQLGTLSVTIPKSVPSGDYLARIEQIGLHVVGAPQWYISCAQITITGGGSASPSKVVMPPYTASDAGLTVNIYAYPAPSPYLVPGPRPFTG
ncbi:glycosyl hydrolase family 61-domain-containing protein [Auriculariales sp. MPI-PUGE-AT-0066]|nr:glycosyl hydrolase family 61-domain-containing protein [Auriculariales sp. MPI-PUGE-AT-0066]